MLAKSGTILPFSMDKGNSLDNPQKLAIHVYKGDGSFTLYEDGRERGTSGEAFTYFTAIGKNGRQILTVKATDEGKVLPKNRVLRVIFKDIPEGDVSVYCNGEKQPNSKLYLHNAAVEFTIETGKDYRVEVSYREHTELENLIARAQQVLLRAEEHFEEKNKLFRECQTVKSIEEYKILVEKSTVSTVTKLRLLETLQ